MMFDKATGKWIMRVTFDEPAGSSTKEWRMGMMGGPTGNHLFACRGSLLCSWFIPPNLTKTRVPYAIPAQIYPMPSRIISFQVGFKQVITSFQ